MIQTDNYILLNGDCLELMPKIPAASVDAVICDLPYGTTQNKWDSVIDLPSLWGCYKRLIKSNGVIVLTAQTPFDKVLGSSNLEWLRYEWIWRKEYATGHLNAKKAPLKNHENVLVFYNKLPTYNPQFTEGAPYTGRKLRELPAEHTSNYGKHKALTNENDGFRYPVTVITMGKKSHKAHPTQKPVELMEYLVKTYTNPGDTILDNCFGSGTTGVAALNTGRRFIGIEREKEYYEICAKRLADATQAEEVKQDEQN